MRVKNTIRLIAGLGAACFVSSAFAAPLPHTKPTTTVKHIASFGDYAVINLSKDLINGTDPTNKGKGTEITCQGPINDVTQPDKIRTYFMDYSTAEGKANYVLVMAAAAAKKKVAFIATTCDNSTGVDLPAVDSVEVLF